MQASSQPGTGDLDSDPDLNISDGPKNLKIEDGEHHWQPTLQLLISGLKPLDVCISTDLQTQALTQAQTLAHNFSAIWIEVSAAAFRRNQELPRLI